MVLSTHGTPDSELACVVPPTPATRDDDGNSRRVASAPAYGVAASRVSLISRIFVVSFRPDATCLRWRGACQVRQGALYQVLPQVAKGARRCTAHVSWRVRAQPGQG